MRVTHQPPAPAIEPMVQAVLLFEMPDGQVVTIRQWSLAELDWPEDAPKAPKAGTLSVPFQGVDVRFPVRLSPSPDRPGAQILSDLSGRQRETLALFYRSLLSGKMACSEDVITSLDTPLDLVPMEETVSEKEVGQKSPTVRALRVAFSVATYVALACVVFGVIGQSILTNLDRIDIQHGRVVGPTTHLVAPQAGTVSEIIVSSGDHVTAGSVLARVKNPSFEADLEKARASLAASELALERVNVALDELDRVGRHQDETIRLAGIERIYEAHDLEGRFSDIRERWLALDDRGAPSAYPHDPFEITRRRLLEKQEFRTLELRRSRVERSGRREIAKSTRIVAPTDGIISEVLIQQGQFVTTGAATISLEAEELRQTVGWVSERFAETLYIGMPASVGFNDAGRKAQIDGVISDIQAGDHPDRPGEYGILVWVQPSDMDLAEARNRLRIGAPVNLEAKRQITNRAKNWLRGWLPNSEG